MTSKECYLLLLVESNAYVANRSMLFTGSTWCSLGHKEVEVLPTEEPVEPVEMLLNVLGYCPTCNSPVVAMEKRSNGYCWCTVDHKFLFKDALKKPKETPLV